MPSQTQKIAKERIRILFEEAEKAYPEHPERAQRYADLARKIAMRARVHLPRDLRRRICSKCKAYLVPGSSSRTRIRQRREPHVAITCLKCGHTTRIPLRRKK
jgi:ribonuclease P protein subunit RPR2